MDSGSEAQLARYVLRLGLEGVELVEGNLAASERLLHAAARVIRVDLSDLPAHLVEVGLGSLTQVRKDAH